MPQLVKGGKYVFGWSFVHPDGKIMIPPEARMEYRFIPGDKLIIMNGSKTSLGFALTNPDLLHNTPFGSMINKIPEIKHFKELENGFISFQKRIFSWTSLDEDGYIKILPETLSRYFIIPGDKILAGRGSGLALAFLKQGAIINEAIKHHELELFK